MWILKNLAWLLIMVAVVGFGYLNLNGLATEIRIPGAVYSNVPLPIALFRGDNEEALLAFAETVRIDTDNVDAYIHIGNLLRERGEPARAINVHRELTVRSGLTTAQERTVRESLVLDLIALGRADQAV